MLGGCSKCNLASASRIEPSSTLSQHAPPITHDLHPHLDAFIRRQDAWSQEILQNQLRIESHLVSLKAQSTLVGVEFNSAVEDVSKLRLGQVNGVPSPSPMAESIAKDIPSVMVQADSPKDSQIKFDNTVEKTILTIPEGKSSSTLRVPAAKGMPQTPEMVSPRSGSPPSDRFGRAKTVEMLKLDARAHWRKKVRKKAAHIQFLALKRRPTSQHSYPHLQRGYTQLGRLVKSREYEAFMLSMILLNAIFIGWQVQYVATSQKDPHKVHIFAEIFFCAVFAIEIAVRIASQGLQFVSPPENLWNMFDLTVVVIAVVDQLITRFSKSDSDVLSRISVLRVLRVLRITRVLRLVRVLRYFRELRMLLYSTVAAMRSLLWVAFILVTMLYIFGLCFTQASIDHWQSEGKHHAYNSGDVYTWFGTLDRSMLSLFESMAGGVSWGELVDDLRPVGVFYVYLFIAFISMSVIAIANVITGVFVDIAVTNAQQDRENLINEELYAKQEYITKVESMFREIDADRSDDIGLDEFEKAIQNERVVAYFNAIGLDLTDVESLFVLLDRDGNGTVDLEEFLVGCMRLKGTARSLDLAKLALETDWIKNTLESVVEALCDIRVRMKAVNM